MKTVFDNRMVAHVWAQRSQTYGRSSNGQFYFDGAVLYSYGAHFKVAKFQANSEGEIVAVLFNNRSYSLTTSKHQSFARQAVYGLGFPCIEVDNCDPRTDADHLANFKALIALRDKSQAASEAARKDTKRDEHRLAAERYEARANEYASLFIKGDPSKLAAKLKREDAKAQRERVQREAKRAAELAKAKAEVAPIVAHMVELWRANNNEWDAIHSHYDGQIPNPDTVTGIAIREAWQSVPTMLRVVGDEIETSRGARFPVEHAKRAFRILAAIVAKGEAWEAAGHTIPLGHFKIDRIAADGTITAGCHTVAWTEVVRCAEALGLAA